METALDSAEQLVTEGRDHVRKLRGSVVPLDDLPAAFQRVAEETPRVHPATFTTLVEGNVRELHPMVLDESFAIGREALINALTHSLGEHVEAEIIYDARQFRLRIRDDGRGIEPGILGMGGRSDHWGLQGMRERASRIGARLEFWSRPNSGTEVELIVPASSAYRTQRLNTRWFRFPRS
jgi:signal transduction histidine kinase